MKNKDLLQCALGVHRFDKEDCPNWFLCSICERARYYKDSYGRKVWYEYNKQGRLIHYKTSDGHEW